MPDARVQAAIDNWAPRMVSQGIERACVPRSLDRCHASLDESVAFADGDMVLVPRAYHAGSCPPGYELYYLNVIGGPRREWLIANDPDHEWLLAKEAT